LARHKNNHDHRICVRAKVRCLFTPHPQPVGRCHKKAYRACLPPVVVSAPKKRDSRDTHHAAQDSRERPRMDVARIPRSTAPNSSNASQGSSPTPLNSNAIATSASRLGLTVRETPATVEVISAETMRAGLSHRLRGSAGRRRRHLRRQSGRARSLLHAASPTARSTRSTTASRSVRRT